MKVIFVTREGYNLAGGRIRCYNFAKELSRRGIKTEVLSYADNLGAKDGIYEASMGSTKKIKHNITAYKRLSQERNAIVYLQRVNYHSFAPFLSCLIKRDPLVLDIDDWEIREDPRYLFGFYPTSKAEYLTKKIASGSFFCVSASSYLRDYLRQFNKNVYYISSCVDVDLFRPDGKSRERNIVKFAWIGTLHRRDDVENIRFAVDCFKELKKRIDGVSLDIVGEGIYSKEISLYLSNLSLKDCINFVGWIEPDKMPLYLESIDIGLFPLTQNTKFNLSKSPVKLFEYMAMEKPAVSSSVGEAGIIIENGKDGFLAKDRDDFINKMEILVRNPKLREEIGKRAREKVKEGYSLDIAGERLFQAFKERLCR